MSVLYPNTQCTPRYDCILLIINIIQTLSALLVVLVTGYGQTDENRFQTGLDRFGS